MDMSKAYDRVKLPMLIKAMKRIKISEQCIRFISSLFYKVISPLLWYIYYDPLLCEVKNNIQDETCLEA